MNILLIAPTFFNYYKKIISNMEQKGNKVTWYCDSISLTFIERFLMKFNLSKFEKKFDRYFDNILREEKNKKYDKVILIFGGTFVKSKHINSLKKLFKEAEFIYYTWDTIKNFPNIANFYKCFDRMYSFDIEDCEKYGFKFLPLFFSEDFKEDDIINSQYSYGCLMSMSPNKIDNYIKIKQSLPDGIVGKEHLYMQHKYSYFYYKIRLYNKFKFVKKKNVSFKPLSYEDTMAFFRNCNVVIDCPLKDQKGLTIRTFEVLNLHKKIITTNEEIKKYDFYTPSNVCVVDGKNKIPKSFFDEPFDTKYSLDYKYSIGNFVQEILYDDKFNN